MIKLHLNSLVFFICLIFSINLFFSCQTLDNFQGGPIRPENIISLIPSDAKFFIFMDMQQILATPFFEKDLLKDMINNESFQESLAELKIDLENDVYSISCLTFDEYLFGNDITQEAVILINMDYNKEVLFSYIKEQKLSEEQYRGKIIYKRVEQQNDNSQNSETHYMSILSDNLMLLGDYISLKKVIDRYNKKDTQPNRELDDVLVNIDKTTTFWGGFTLNSYNDEENAPDSFLKIFNAIKGVAFACNFDESLYKFKISLLCMDKKLNQQLTDIIKGLIATASLNQDLDENLKQIYENFEINHDSGGVNILFHVSPEQLEKLEKKENDLQLPDPNTDFIFKSELSI